MERLGKGIMDRLGGRGGWCAGERPGLDDAAGENARPCGGK